MHATSLRWFFPLIPALVASLLLFPACDAPEVRKIPEEAVWKELRKKALLYNLDPGFLYAIVWAESSLNARADSGKARGIMQVSEDAWSMVTDQPWSRAYNWRVNIEMGARYLALNRDFLIANKQFNYPLLAACYRFGRGTVQRAGFNLDALPEAKNRIYQEIFRGNIHPVALPGG